ncbi:large ribosomal subunit protein P1-like [Cynocephalus volans]|uniref:large ribosomal subunit protein P1-like n=1 Tax=Cynocephalus volans TaxID=110931 RepID=UPI002FCAD414
MYTVSFKWTLMDPFPQLPPRCSVLPRSLRPQWGEALTSSGSTSPALAHTVASISELPCTYSTLILHNTNVTITEDKINALIKAAGVNTGSFWPGLFAKALTSVNTESLICNAGAGGPAPAAGATPAGGPAPSTTAAPAEEKKVEAKKQKSEKCDDDMGFGLFDKTSFVTS